MYYAKVAIIMVITILGIISLSAITQIALLKLAEWGLNKMIKDSGDRTEYKTGAVRDLKGGKGRCDLLPLTEVAELLDNDKVILDIAAYKDNGNPEHIKWAIEELIRQAFQSNKFNAVIELSMHFEEGAIKYGAYNWQKGIPEQSYIDSAVRHYLKYRRGDEDERHDRACLWNLICLWWTHDNKPEVETPTEKTGTTEADKKICGTCAYLGYNKDEQWKEYCFKHDTPVGSELTCRCWSSQ